MTEYIKTNNIRDILKGAVTELLKKQPKNARTFLGQWIGQAQQIDTTRLMLVSSDTPDRADFLDMVKCLKAQYAFETQTPGELVAIIRALVAAHGKFKSIALASHGPASAESTWAISSKAVVDMADQKGEGFKVLEALAEAVQTGGRVDLLACNLIASPEGKSFLKDLEDRTGCNFAASVDKTGNPQDVTTDWIMESDNVDIRDFYFTNTALFDGSFEANGDDGDDGEDEKTIVMDCGSGFMKVGFAGDIKPVKVFPLESLWINAGDKKIQLTCETPALKRGMVTNWEYMEGIWHHSFYKVLKVAPEKCSVLIVEPPLNPKDNREKMCQIMFETFNVHECFLQNTAVLALYAFDKATGVVLDSGYGVTHAVPIYEGYPLPHAIVRLNLAGCDLTEYLMKELSVERKDARGIKEKLCYVASDYNEPNMTKKQYKLSNGRRKGETITVGKEQYQCPEILFKPSLKKEKYDGIHKCLYNSINKVDDDIRKDLYANICISGGSTMFKGFHKRLEKEVRGLAQGSKVKIFTKPDVAAGNLAWIGGKVAGYSTFEDMWVTKDEYAEAGPSKVHQKCT